MAFSERLKWVIGSGNRVETWCEQGDDGVEGVVASHDERCIQSRRMAFWEKMGWSLFLGMDLGHGVGKEMVAGLDGPISERVMSVEQAYGVEVSDYGSLFFGFGWEFAVVEMDSGV